MKRFLALSRAVLLTATIAVLASACTRGREADDPSSMPPAPNAYGQQPYGQPAAQPYGYGNPQPGYAQPYGAQPYGQPAAAPAAPMAPGPATPAPSPFAAPCQADGGICGTHRCNLQVGRCALPCGSNSDCLPGFSCLGAGGPTAICLPGGGQ